VVRPDGGVRWLETQAEAYRAGNGIAVRMIGVTQDITERKEAEELVQQMAFYDTLTGLPNRNHLIDRLLNAIRVDSGIGRPMALMLMDLDSFKEINDTLGHHRGDLLLKEVGSRLKNVLFEPDLVARLGGDEFAVLLPKLARSEDVALVVRKIQNALHPPFIIEGLPIAIEASIGTALYPQHGTNPDSLLQRADVALYSAKESGRGHTLYAPELDRHSPQRLALLAELRQAIELNQLLLHYQPKVTLKEGKVSGVEGLVRWRHPQRGMIPPDEFIGLAERSGQIYPLTDRVLQTAMRQCSAWRREGFEIPVSVNLSARNLLDPKLPETVAGLLEVCDVAPSQLQFEITESAIMADPARAQETMIKLHRLGIRFSIDDFGIGYSSLSYLQKLPVDKIKVDKSFVIHMTRNRGDAQIVHSTIELAHNLGLKVVAEGVETEEILNCLAEIGCDEAQGYFISRPVSAEELTRWLGDSPWGVGKPS
ncbi:MAG TPA: EAL domain-containing protein, partial [Candidatus Manganitrophaceae bacterium]|nr:EAL domain-containing protein [Candidatus Manganitrophaceae bacterium]